MFKRLWLYGALLVLGVAGSTAFGVLRGSLPQLTGQHQLAGLSAPVNVDRDAQGVPWVRGQSRLDVARATGYLHAQERFFQMDLLRRRAAGELSALVGSAALQIDTKTRRNGFRALAQQVIAGQDAEARALVDAYVAGVNAGLAALRNKPWEYQLLRVDPTPWQAEDTILCLYAMWLDLQDSDAAYDRTLLALREGAGDEALALLGALGSPDDAALDGSHLPQPALPAALPTPPHKSGLSAAVHAPNTGMEPPFMAGSNSFAVSGAHTATGAALLANDMHLGLRLPHVWYHAALAWRDAQGQPRQVVGVMLPGTPAMVVGSNGRVAWGFTNSNVDTVDAVALTDADAVTETTARIEVKGQKAQEVTLRLSAHGPVVTARDAPVQYALRWNALRPEAANLSLMQLEDASTAAEALQIGHRAGMPNQNLLAVDGQGHIGWTVTGSIPRYDDRDSWLPQDEVPTLLDPDEGLFWTANNRIVGGRALALLGDGGYDGPQRAASIRDDLRARAQAAPQLSERDLLAVQLGDRAAHLDRWRDLLLQVLARDPELASQPAALALRVELHAWQGHAAIDSAGYRLIREFRGHVWQQVLAPYVAAAQTRMPEADLSRLRPEAAVWRLVTEQPATLLNPAYASWDALMSAAAAATLSDAGGTAAGVQAYTWGQRNVLRMRHPLSASLPGFVARQLDAPFEPLPGDREMARVQTPISGASERLVVSPGHEDSGLFHMPGGQSGHPLSPYYLAGHDDWARGRATPLLPGEPKYQLALLP